MTDANYIKVFTILGKLCFGYDLATTQATACDDILATLQDQVATGSPDSNPVNTTLRQTYSSIEQARDSGANFAKSVYKTGATNFLASDYFFNKLTTVPTSRSAAAVLAALETEMAVGLDNKKLTTLASTGLVNFFNSMLAAPGTWNTVADASADYKDSVYVVDAVI
jgi:hypothetical protein